MSLSTPTLSNGRKLGSRAASRRGEQLTSRLLCFSGALVMAASSAGAATACHVPSERARQSVVVASSQKARKSTECGHCPPGLRAMIAPAVAREFFVVVSSNMRSRAGRAGRGPPGPICGEDAQLGFECNHPTTSRATANQRLRAGIAHSAERLGNEGRLTAQWTE